MSLGPGGSGLVGTRNRARSAKAAPSGTIRHSRVAIAGGIDHLPAADLLDQEITDVLSPVVDHRGTAKHGVAAGPGLAVAVERERETVGPHDQPAAEDQVPDPVAQRAPQVDFITTPAMTS